MVSTTKTAQRRATGRPLRSPLAAPAAWSAPDQQAGSTRLKAAEDLSDRQATIAEFTDYLRTITNRDNRPYQEASINAYVGPAKNLDAWLTESGIDGDFDVVDTHLLNRYFRDYFNRHGQGGTHTLQRNLLQLFNYLQAERDIPSPCGKGLYRYAEVKGRPSTLSASFIDDLLERRAQGEPSWPALAAALRRASIAGHDPATVLIAVARSRELRSARNISQTLAWRIGRYLTANPSPLADALCGKGSVSGRETWRLLAWTLKAAEDNGIPAEQILATARRARDIRDVIAVVSQAALRHSAEPAAASLPPWLRSPPAHAGGGMGRYLDDAATLISARVRVLGSRRRTRPARLDEPPRHHRRLPRPAPGHHRRPATGPRPLPEPGKAGHAAYWHAADAVLAARRIAAVDTAPGPRQPDQIGAQIAADIYRALPDGERRDIAATIASRPGPAWLGHPSEPDEHAVT
ncbi:MAG TPA: hypothetical protein VFB06_05585 [Streptosporangiaceae bacterium]|nr:hypothetical protein [Streptosporangiaceae bacterium]